MKYKDVTNQISEAGQQSRPRLCSVPSVKLKPKRLHDLLLPPILKLMLFDVRFITYSRPGGFAGSNHQLSNQTSLNPCEKVTQQACLFLFDLPCQRHLVLPNLLRHMHHMLKSGTADSAGPATGPAPLPGLAADDDATCAGSQQFPFPPLCLASTCQPQQGSQIID